MRPRNCLAYRLALPLAIVVGPAPLSGAAPIVPHTSLPAGEPSGPSVSKPKEVGKGAPASRRRGNESSLPPSPRRGRSASLESENRPISDLGDPSVPRTKDEGNEVKDVTPPDQANSASAAQDLPTGGLLLLPLPPNPEPGEVRTYVGEPSGTTGPAAAASEVTSPVGIGAHDASSLPRGTEGASTPRDPVRLSPPVTPAASAPIEHTPGDRASIPSVSGNSTNPGTGDPVPVSHPLHGANPIAAQGAAGPVLGSPSAANAPVGSSATGSTVKDPGGAGTAPAEAVGGAPVPTSPTPAAQSPAPAAQGPAPAAQSPAPAAQSPAPAAQNPAPAAQVPGGAKPTGVANGAGTSGLSTGVRPESQTSATANIPGQVSGSSGGPINEAVQGGGGMSSVDQANAFGQMLTTAVLAQELTNPGRTGAGGTSQVEPPTNKTLLSMSDRALLSEVGGTTRLDANPGASGDAGAAGATDSGTGASPLPSPSVPPELPLPAVEAGEDLRQAAAPVVTSDASPSPSISPAAIPEPTPLLQFVVVLAGSAFVFARRRVQA